MALVLGGPSARSDAAWCGDRGVGPMSTHLIIVDEGPIPLLTLSASPSDNKVLLAFGGQGGPSVALSPEEVRTMAATLVGMANAAEGNEGFRPVGEVVRSVLAAAGLDAFEVDPCGVSGTVA